MQTNLLMIIILQALSKDFTLAVGIVECHLDDVVLGGTVIRTYSGPENVSCIGEELPFLSIRLTCKWDHNQNGVNTNYTVHVKQKGNELFCQSRKMKWCTFSDSVVLNAMNVTVTAQTSAGEARSEVTYNSVWEILKLDPPRDVQVKPELSGLSVTWWSNKWALDFSICEVRFLEKGSEPVVKTVEKTSKSTFDLTEVKPCTSYTISVRCRINVWSEWSQTVTHLTSLNVSNVQLHLWRSKGVVYDQGKRAVHLMWKGINPLCKAFDEYRLFNHTPNLVTSRSFKPSENHTVIIVDENAHRVTVAAFRNNKSLSEASMEIPSTAEEFSLPPVDNVNMFARDGQIHIAWDKPYLAVTGYIIIWNSTEEDHQWQQTQERHFSLKGENFTLYTISLMPLYENGPGSEIRLHTYAQEGGPAVVSNVRAERICDRKAEIHWRPISSTQCCAFVVSYTVFYKTRNDIAVRNVTVDQKEHSVILDDLQPKTNYIVYVQANSMAASSKSSFYTFSTKPYGEVFLITLIVCGVGLMLLPVCTVFVLLIRKEYLNEKVPNPRFSSLSIWSSQKCRNPWNQLPMPWGCDPEKSLTCQVEAEDYSILATSTRDVAKLQQNTAIQEMTTTQTENAALVSSSSETELASDGKEERMKALSAMDLETPRIHPVLLSQSPYKNQTPLTSPVDSPRKGLQGTTKPRSEETETLLKPKIHNATMVTTYVTVDVFEHGKSK
ncbi:interleukin-31 receptor subunit alpha-like isoform X2 [Colossoma macropomum]|uniref:interleukin-31 receptor subunit alpha-like isoform X2 n=1 Tax=Colossoma macropomum TaxID=42526 RepID=UPI001863C68B|nr:interleukin-31 receptor subunit alpha-like isoform X2 [Colossoma macropomum]